MPALIRFSVFEADLASGELYRQGRLVPLQQQPFEVLRALLEQPGGVITRAALRQRLWPDGVVVDFDQSLNKSLTKLRDALGDRASNPRFIQTLPKRGYRFIAPVSRQPPPQPDPPSAHVSVSTPSSLTSLPQASSLWLPVLALTLIVGALLAFFAGPGRSLTSSRPSVAPAATTIRAQAPSFTPIAAARDSYERGRLALARGSEASIRQSVELFQRAIALSPRYSAAHAALAHAWLAVATENGPETREAVAQAREAAARALTLDPGQASAHAALGRIAFEHDQDWEVAEGHFRRAIAVDSGNADARASYAVALSARGRHEEAEAEARRALAADPYGLTTNAAMAQVLYRASRYDEAAIANERAIEIDPDYPPAHRLQRQLSRLDASARPLAVASSQ